MLGGGGLATARPAPPEPAVRRALYGLLASLLVGVCAGYAWLVLATQPWAAAVPLRIDYDWQPPLVTAAAYQLTRNGLALGAALALGLAGALAGSPAGRTGLRALGRAGRAGGRRLLAGWRALPPARRRWAWALLAGLTGLRVANSLLAQGFDDAMSYELFARARLLDVSAAYPAPNNHVLSNTVAWGFARVYPGFWWTMRLPVLLTSTAATALWFLVLLRRAGYGAALGVVVGFGLLFNAWYFATVGRGYWLLIGFCAVAAAGLPTLAAPAAPLGRRALAWASLVLSGALGLYTVPTHVYFLLSVYGGLGLLAATRRPRVPVLGSLGALGVAAGLTGLGAGLLYAPLLLLSGPAQLLHNPYVRAMPLAEFWQSLPEAVLVTHRLIGIPLAVAVLVWLVGQCRAARRGRATQLTGPQLALGVASGWFIVFPYAVALVQRVQPPERAFLYKDFFFFVLAGLWVQAQWSRPPAAWLLPRTKLRVLVAVGVLYGASQLGRLVLWEQRWRAYTGWHYFAPAAAWLAAQPAGPVLVPDISQRTLLRFYAHAYYFERSWQFDAQPRPGVRYAYLVAEPAGAKPAPANGRAQLAFANRSAAIYRLPPGRPAAQ